MKKWEDGQVVIYEKYTPDSMGETGWEGRKEAVWSVEMERGM